MRLVILGSLLLAACTGRQVNELQTRSGRIHIGLSPDAVSAVLGPPHYVGKNVSATLGNITGTMSHYRKRHFRVSGTGSLQAIEWAWELDNGDVAVAWIDHGTVVALGTVSADKRKADDPIRGVGRR